MNTLDNAINDYLKSLHVGCINLMELKKDI